MFFSVRIKYLEDTLGKKMRELEELSNFKANYDQISEYNKLVYSTHTYIHTLSLPLSGGQLKAKDVEIEKLKKFLNKAKKVSSLHNIHT